MLSSKQDFKYKSIVEKMAMLLYMCWSIVWLFLMSGLNCKYIDGILCLCKVDVIS